MLPSVAALAIKALDPERGRLVILGDPKQMRPTIRTQLPEDTDVGASILDLAVRQLRGSPCLGRLDENHRMCGELCDFTETALGYPGYCICSKGGCQCRRAARPSTPLSFTGADATLLDEASPLVVVELAGNGVPLADLRAAEAARCADLVRAYDAGAFVVTPHHAQRLAVSAALGPLAARCTIDTVERMQGRERDLVIVCFAGLDPYGDDDGVELDFVYDACRIVVALTRAKRKCVVPRLVAFLTRRCTSSTRRRGARPTICCSACGRMRKVAALLWPGRSQRPLFWRRRCPRLCRLLRLPRSSSSI